MYHHMQLKIGELLINNENPRYEAVTHQREAIETMLHEQKEKLAKLASHIVDFGLSPIDTVLVEPEGNLWVVKEGNRRITALKLLSQPDLVPDELVKLRKAFKSMAANMDTSLLENIPCVYCDDPDVANEWIRLKHTGENEGAGTVSWNPQQSGRFLLQTSDKPAPKMVFLEYLKTNTNIPEGMRKQLSKIHKTNFERLISDVKVRDYVGIIYEDGVFSLREPIPEEFLIMLDDLLEKNIKVNDIYYSENRKKYIQDIEQRIEKSRNLNTNATAETPGIPNIIGYHDYAPSSNSNNSTTPYPKPLMDMSSSSTIANKKKVSYPVNRNYLIPSTCSMPIEKGRIKSIFNELKSLPLNAYPNAVAVLFRVFVELTADHYITKKHIAKVSVDSDLGKKIEAIAQDFEQRSVMTNHELLAARKMVSSQNSTQSIKTFHSYVHNVSITPIGHDLCTAWDDIVPFIMKTWEEL